MNPLCFHVICCYGNKVNYQKADLEVISVSGKVSKRLSDGDNGNYTEYKRT